MEVNQKNNLKRGGVELVKSKKKKKKNKKKKKKKSAEHYPTISPCLSYFLFTQ
jgi:hypothetical protein